MKMTWSKEGDLQFGIFMKENQKLKYLNQGITHCKSCFAAIFQGRTGRLAKLTTRNAENEDKKLNVLFPDHAAAMDLAGILSSDYPMLGKRQDEPKQRSEEKAEKKPRGIQEGEGERRLPLQQRSLLQ